MVRFIKKFLLHHSLINIVKKIFPFFILLIFASICFLSQSSNSVTVDEFSHFPSGLYILKTHDWRMDKESPPLIKCLPALSSMITNSKIEIQQMQESPNTWQQGYSFMHLNRDQYQSIFTYGRCIIIILGSLMGLTIYFWGKELYGYKGALFALSLYAFNPNILAHSSLVTIDIGASLMIFLSGYCLWKYLRKPTAFAIVLAGVILGLAQLSKFTALLLYPIYFLILMTLCFSGICERKEDRLKKLKSNILRYSQDFSIIILISIFIINLGYLFSDSFKPLSEYQFSSKPLHALSSFIWSRFPVPLPYHYLMGFDSQLVQSAGGNPFYMGYLMGEHSMSGWWYYYIIAFLVKNPVSLLIILCLTIIVWLEIKIAKKDIITFLCIFAPLISYFAYFSFFTNIPIGIRYLLPVFPFLFLSTGYLMNESIIKYQSIKFILSFLIVSYILSSIIAFPNYLSYFNFAAGGSQNGDRWLIDSNLDWGQSLPDLKKYMDKNRINKIKLGYFGRVDPTIYGIKYSLAEREPSEGIYAISINFLVGRPYYLLKEDAKELLYIDFNYFDKYRNLKPSAIVGNSIYIFDMRTNYKASVFSAQ